MFRRLAIVFASFIAAAAIVICAVPLKTVSHTEYYQEAQQVQVDMPLSHGVAHHWTNYDLGDIITIGDDLYYQGVRIEENQYEFYKKYVHSYLEILNTDDVAGNFTVRWRCEGPRDTYYVSTKSIYILPAQLESISYEGYIPLDEKIYWQVSPPTKTVTEWRVEEKERTVYEKVSLLNYLLHY